jgi:hypothetical protein
VGTTANDQIGYDDVTALSNGHYAVSSPYWDNGGTADAGAVTLGNGTTGIIGTVSPVNSLVGTTANDQVGYGGVTALSNGHYVVSNPYWDNGSTMNAGAVTLGWRIIGTTGPITDTNSVRGTAASGGPSMVFAYDYTNSQLVVGRPADNIVTLFGNDAPVADAGSNQAIDTLALVTLNGSDSTDPDGDLPLTYLWVQTGGLLVSFTPGLSITTFTAPDDPSVLTFTLVVTDSLGLSDPTPDEVVVTVDNQPPVADAGGNQSADTTAVVSLDGSGSSDPDGDLPLTYYWTQTGGPAVTLSNPAVVAPVFTAPDDPAVLTFTLVVTDSLGLPDPTPDEVVVTVNNQSPNADAGDDQSVDTGALVTLDGSGSSDPDGDLPLTYYWTQTGGPAVILNNPVAVAPTFTAPGDPAVLTFTLAVTDSLDLPDPTPDEVVITVERYRIYLPLVVRQASSGAEVIAPPSLAWSRRPSWRFQRALPTKVSVIQASLVSGGEEPRSMLGVISVRAIGSVVLRLPGQPTRAGPQRRRHATFIT